MIENKNKW